MSHCPIGVKSVLFLVLFTMGAIANGQQANPDFGIIPVGGSETQLVWFYLGTSPLQPQLSDATILGVIGQSSPFSISPSCGGNSCFLYVTFHPTQEGGFGAFWQATLTIPPTVLEDGSIFPGSVENVYGEVDGTAAGPGLDLAVSGVTVNSQQVQIVPQIPFEVDVSVTGSGFDSPETRNTTITLQAGRHSYSQTIQLANIPTNGPLNLPFSVTFDPDEIGAQTISAIIDPNDDLQEANRTNNSGSTTVDVEPANVHLMLSITLEKSEVNPSIPHRASALPYKTKVTAKVGSTDRNAILGGHAVSFSSVPEEFSGGHDHSGGRPTGTFSKLSCITDATGQCTVTYSASEVAGREDLAATLAEDSSIKDTKSLQVRVAGLQIVQPGNFYILTGQKAAHPNNHYSATDAIYYIAAEYNRRYALYLGLNDMSLEDGGLFDIGPPDGLFWNTPHKAHRTGYSFDISRCAARSLSDVIANGACSSILVPVQKKQIKEICKAFNGYLVQESSIHCEIRPE